MNFSAVFAGACMIGAVAVPALIRAQTADPSATPPSAAVSAPAAKAGTYAVAQGGIVAAPGLVIPNGNLPWALDTINGQSALVPIHHSVVKETAAEPVAGAAPVVADAPAVASNQITHTLQSAHARTVLRGDQPVFFIHASDRTENTGDAGRGNPTGWALVLTSAASGSRTFPHVRFAQISAATACAAPVVCVQAETLPDGWLRLSAKAALTPGDYALLPVPRQPKPGVVIVYDFQIDPAAPLAADAVHPGQGPAPATKHHKHQP